MKTGADYSVRRTATLARRLRSSRVEIMSIFGWILLGLIAGFIGSKIVNKTGQGMIMDIALGIAGAIVGGTLFSLIGAVGITGFNPWSLIVAVIGSVVVLWLYHKFGGRRAR
jgi:uncharacterized membrane protein YeaQ/YmgE (transglycosylase-associated protein family)